MEFEWDPAKAAANLEKHGVDFRDAAQVFDHPMLVLRDTRRTYGEERLIGVGLARGRVLTVVFTMRGESCRIISARRASRRERKAFQQG